MRSSGTRTAPDRDDAIHGHELKLVRTVDIPAGRVQPGAEYARFLRFIQSADELLARNRPRQLRARLGRDRAARAAHQ